jgi:bifunctional non-homologous end joining protein LigD
MSFPEWLEPMAATLTQERFTGPEWIFERKFDGIRLLAFKRGADVRLVSRNRLPQNIPSIAAAIAKLPIQDVILDGEVTWGEVTAGKGTGGGVTRGKVAYHVFDIMWLDGRDVTSLPLDARRALLNELPLREPLQRVTSLDDRVVDHLVLDHQGLDDLELDERRLNDLRPWERAQKEGWEGVIAKRRDSLYEHRRSRNWLKMKCEATQELVVGGFTDPQGRRVGLGALLVGYFEGDDFVFAGKVGTGFDTKLLLDLRARLDTLEITRPPFTRAIGLPRVRAHWVHPEIVVQVGFIEWTVHGKLRHPRLLGISTDKTARDVVREQA